MGAQQVYLQKCLEIIRFFPVLRWVFFVIVDKLFRSVGRGEGKIVLQTKAKKCLEFFPFCCMRTCFLFLENKKKLATMNLVNNFFKSLSLSVCFVNKLAFCRVSNRSRYLVNRYIVWTDFNNLKYSVGIESLVRH